MLAIDPGTSIVNTGDSTLNCLKVGTLPLQEEIFRNGCFIDLAVPCLGKASGYGDDTVWSGYLEFVVDEAWLGHEGVEYVAAEYDVVHALEGDHLKGHALLTIVINIAKGNLKCDAPKGPSLPTRNYAVEDGVGPP